MDFTIEELSKRAADIQSAADEIVTRYQEISSLKEAAVWKSDALALQNLFNLFEIDLVRSHEVESGLLHNEENTLKNLSFFKILTASQKSIKIHRENLDIIQNGIDSIEVAKSVIAGIIDETPIYKAELKQKLNDLIVLKKELTVNKRTVNEEMRQIRTAARQQTAKMSGLRGGTVGKIARYQRAGITMSKEKALSPMESTRGDIESQLIETEKQINRLKGIKVDEEGNIEAHVPRCAYCGRRVNSDKLCPGCGSDTITHELN